LLAKTEAEDAAGVHWITQEITPEAVGMWGQIKKFAPFAAVLGYALVYMNKGWDRVLVDLQSISIAKLQAKWQQIAMIVVAAVAMYFIKNVRMSTALKTLILVGLYVFIGYNAALVIDPAGCGGRGEPTCGTRWVTPKARNPYAGGK
jgi:hypothetical protein